MRAIPLLCLALLTACRADPPPPPVSARVWGARAIHTDGRLVFDATRTPVVELELKAEGWRLQLGAQPLDTAVAQREGRWILSVTAPQQAPATADLVLLDAQARPRARWPAEWAVAPSALPDLAPAVAARKAGTLDAADAKLAPALSHPDGRTRLWATVEAGRIDYRRGAMAAAAAHWAEAARQAEALGLPSEAAARQRAQASIKLRAHDYEAARRLLDAATATSRRLGDHLGTLRGHAQRGALALQLGASREAVTRLTSQLDEAARLGLHMDRVRIASQLLFAWSQLGRHDKANHLGERILAPVAADATTPVTTRVTLLTDLAWARLQRPDRPASDLDRAAAALQDAQRLSQQLGNPSLSANLTLNLAWVRHAQGDAAQALELLSRLLPSSDDQTARWSAELLRGRLEIDRGHAEAAAERFRRLVAETGAAEDADYRWRAALGHAQARRALGQPARAAIEAALAALDRAALGTALRDGRAPFFADRAVVVDEAISILLSEGDVAAAFRVADAARARVHRRLGGGLGSATLPPAAQRAYREAVSRFRLAGVALVELRQSADLNWRPEDQARHQAEQRRLERDRAAAFEDALAQLSPRVAAEPVQARLGAGEVLVAFWKAHTFVVRPTGVTLIEGDAAHALDRAAEGARHLYVVGGPDAALFGAGAPLAARVPISRLPFAGVLAHDVTPWTEPPLVVADPTRDLSGAAAEGAAVARRFPHAKQLNGVDAQRDALLAAMHGAQLVHYAGHGELHPEDPWQAHLRLADGARLALEDLLVGRPAAGLVVLSGCKTGVAGVLSDAEHLGLPSALLLTGSGAVLATERDLRDGKAAAFLDRFYDAGGVEQPGQAYQRAVMASIAAGDPAWRAFRLWGRATLRQKK